MERTASPPCRAGRSIIVLLSLLLMLSCASRQHLPVYYTLPQAATAAPEKPFHLTFTDHRQDKAIFTEAAAAKFKYDRQLFELVFTVPGASQATAGVMDLSSLFLEALTRKAERSGFAVRQTASPGVPTVIVNLNAFTVDLADSQWTIRVDYDLAIEKNGRTAATQAVSAEGERRKILGNRELQVLVSDLFTDAINRADLMDLFKRADL